MTNIGDFKASVNEALTNTSNDGLNELTTAEFNSLKASIISSSPAVASEIAAFLKTTADDVYLNHETQQSLKGLLQAAEERRPAESSGNSLDGVNKAAHLTSYGGAAAAGFLIGGPVGALAGLAAVGLAHAILPTRWTL